MTDKMTLDFVKNYLRVDYDFPEEDKFIQMLIPASRSFVETYLNRKLDSFSDNGEYPQEIDIARLNLMSMWYDSRTIMSPRSNVKELEYVFSGLLDPHRFWQFAFIDGNFSKDGMSDLDNIYYDRTLNRFYRAEIVDTYTAVTGDDDTSHAPNTSFYAPVDDVDYNQRNKR